MKFLERILGIGESPYPVTQDEDTMVISISP
jgi:hypothetical protein